MTSAPNAWRPASARELHAWGRLSRPAIRRAARANLLPGLALLRTPDRNAGLILIAIAAAMLGVLVAGPLRGLEFAIVFGVAYAALLWFAIVRTAREQIGAFGPRVLEEVERWNRGRHGGAYPCPRCGQRAGRAMWCDPCAQLLAAHVLDHHAHVIRAADPHAFVADPTLAKHVASRVRSHEITGRTTRRSHASMRCIMDLDRRMNLHMDDQLLAAYAEPEDRAIRWLRSRRVGVLADGTDVIQEAVRRVRYDGDRVVETWDFGFHAFPRGTPSSREAEAARAGLPVVPGIEG